MLVACVSLAAATIAGRAKAGAAPAVTRLWTPVKGGAQDSTYLNLFREYLTQRKAYTKERPLVSLCDLQAANGLTDEFRAHLKDRLALVSAWSNCDSAINRWPQDSMAFPVVQVASVEITGDSARVEAVVRWGIMLFKEQAVFRRWAWGFTLSRLTASDWIESRPPDLLDP